MPPKKDSGAKIETSGDSRSRLAERLRNLNKNIEILRPQSDTLLHYCSLDAFYSIMDTARLRFTSARSTNDPSEFIFGERVVQGVLERLPDVLGGAKGGLVLISCKNGLLNLSTGELLAHTPAFFTNSAVDFAYDPKAPKPDNWLAFLKQIWPRDRETVDTLQELFGYCLSADTSQQKAFLLVGPKRSGKGAIARVLTALLGPDNTVAPTLAGLEKTFGLQPLIGKRVAIIGDARISGRSDAAVIAERLLSITGEDSITVDRKYLSAWTGRLGVRFLILTNQLPRLTDASGALASRLIILMMTETFFGREDRGLTDRLLGELPGILNWAMEGWRRLRERGRFLQPKSAQDAVQELEDLASPIGAFLGEYCAIGAGCEVECDELFSVWEAWCRDQGRGYVGNKQSFGVELRAAVPGLKTKQKSVGPRHLRTRNRYFAGVRLRTEDYPNLGLVGSD
jgi:putative DNA primase/helicase